LLSIMKLLPQRKNQKLLLNLRLNRHKHLLQVVLVNLLVLQSLKLLLSQPHPWKPKKQLQMVQTQNLKVLSKMV
jgi:hypothetical protein